MNCHWIGNLTRFIGALATATTVFTSPASAAAPVDCPDGHLVMINGEQVCIISSDGHILPAGQPIEFVQPRGGGGGVETWCIRHTQRDASSDTNPWRVPCRAGTDDNSWWFHVGWDCYIRARSVERDPSWPRWDVDDNDEGRVFEIRCYPPQENQDGLMYMNGFGLWQASQMIIGPENPPGYEGTPSVIPALWVEAVNSLGMLGPQITTAPPTDGAALVNLPVWLWTETGGNFWPDGDLHAAATAPAVGQRVDAFARPVRIEWQMGDGSDPVVCEGPGDAWRPGVDFLRPGECHHIYRRSSRTEPGGQFEIIAITTWQVWWLINGEEDGELELQVGSTTTYRVDEIQVLNSR